MTEQLKPCPFCGETPEIYQIGLRKIEIKCKCGITRTQKVLRNTTEWLKNKMIERWNTRADKQCEHKFKQSPFEDKEICMNCLEEK